MRIALLSRRFDPEGGGTERDLIVTAEGLLRQGHQVSIYAGEVRGSATGLTVRRVGAYTMPRTLNLIRFAWAAAPMARRDGAELTLSFARVTNADVLRSGGSAHISYLRAAARWRGRAGALAMRANPYHRAQVLIEKRGFTWAALKGTIAVSELVRRDLIGQFHLPPKRVTTIYNGVDLERFRPTSDSAARNEIRRRFEIPETAQVVLFVGNGFARKGLGFLIDAVAAMQDRPYLLIVGTDRAVGAFRARAERNDITSRVLFAGGQPETGSFLHAAGVVALPSLFEPFGNVALEAMASGVPALVSSYCGAAEVIPGLIKSLVVQDPTDSKEIATKLDRMLQAAPELGPLVRKAAEQFTWENYENELNALVTSLG